MFIGAMPEGFFDSFRAGHSYRFVTVSQEEKSLGDARVSMTLDYGWEHTAEVASNAPSEQRPPHSVLTES